VSSKTITERAQAHAGFDVELIDLKQENLPMFDGHCGPNAQFKPLSQLQ
jgi:hypothetical protein